MYRPINRSVNLGEDSKQYGVFPPVTRTRQRQYGLYLQDAWRVTPAFTLNYGLRWDRQLPPEDLIGIYTRPGYEGVWGTSGVGALFQPGASGGQLPQYFPVAPGTPGFKTFNKMFSPSVGFAWMLPKTTSAAPAMALRNARRRVAGRLRDIADTRGCRAPQ